MRLAPIVPLLAAVSFVGCQVTDSVLPPDDGATDTGPVAGDADGDGVPLGEDCDDTDPLVHPGAEERCDGRDNDCDGSAVDPSQRVTVDPGANYATLTEALAAAPDGAVLTVCPGTYPEAVRVARSVTLVGLSTPVLDGSGLGATLEVAGGPVLIEGFVIRGGSGSAAGPLLTNGGGISAWAATGPLTVSSSTIEDNLAEAGGGIAVGPHGATLVDCVVRSNVAGTFGGGIYSDGNLVLDRTVVSGNVSAEDGGGILVGDAADVTLSDSEVVDNTATRGGGIHGAAGTRFESLGSSVIADNVASAYGGGMYVHSAEVVGAVVDANDAGMGAGGIQLVDGGLLDGVVVSGNVAPLGAGLTVSGPATLQLVGTTITGNAATSSAGGVHAITVTIEADDLTFVTGNTATLDGGGIELFEATWEGGTISFNVASEGGGVHVGAGAGLSTVASATVVDNLAVLSADDPPVASGGGVWSAGMLDVIDSVIDRNLSDLRGAGLYATLDARVIVTDTSFDSNAAIERGGGIYANGDAVVGCDGCTIERNQAVRGAGLYNNDNAATTLTDSTVTTNGSSQTVSGGGARVTDGVLFSSCTDWGSGAEDNAADDLFVEGDGPYDGYTTCETFSCSAEAGCSPPP